MKSRTLFILIIAVFAANAIFAQRSAYPDVLNVRNTITKTDDVERSFFSDMGAWHAYALPARKEDFGSFVGPLVMDLSGEWLANTIAKTGIEEDGKPIDLTNAEFSAAYYPGLLEQNLTIAGLKITQKLIFVSGREAMLQTSITNISKRTRSLSVNFSGELLLSGTTFKREENALIVSFPDPEKRFVIDFGSKQKLSFDVTDRSYKASSPAFKLLPNQTAAFVQSQSFFLQKREVTAKSKRRSFAIELKSNEDRWNGYLRKYSAKSRLTDKNKKRLAVKSIVTLMTNWRTAAKDLRHDGVFPSASYQGFYGFWSWDSWKQAVALSSFNPELAKSNILSMFDYQDEAGMVADCIYTDKKENNTRDTKPPLSAWAVWAIFEETGDAAFVREMYPKLIKYHEWWYKNRDTDQNGLCEYGSTDGTKIAAKWESGMDNAVRFDDVQMLKNNSQAWSVNQESVDLNSYLYAEKIYLARLAKVVGKYEDQKRLTDEISVLKRKINDRFYSNSRGFYYDFAFSGEKLITIEGTEGWLPLWAGIASKEQASKVATVMTDEKKFNTKVPLPTFTADHPKFDPLKGYWRGPVWLDQFYFGVEGLKRYGFDKEARMFENKLWNNAEGLLTNGEIRENYHPISGKGLNAMNFSWSAAHILMMMRDSG